jgi:hypothetical protein
LSSSTFIEEPFIVTFRVVTHVIILRSSKFRPLKSCWLRNRLNLFLIVLHKNVEYVELGTSDGKHVTEKDPRWVIRGDDQHMMNDFEVTPST